jgi:hypothetical protein
VIKTRGHAPPPPDTPARDRIEFPIHTGSYVNCQLNRLTSYLLILYAEVWISAVVYYAIIMILPQLVYDSRGDWTEAHVGPGRGGGGGAGVLSEDVWTV